MDNYEFINNKYTGIYYELISRAISRNFKNKKEAKASLGYVEQHHIVPRSIGGSNSKNNLTFVTAREHFLCHWLLTKMVKDNNHHKKMIFSFWRMVNTKNSKRHNVTSKQYEIARLAFHKINSGRIVTEETKQRMRKPKTEEHKAKLAEYAGPNHFSYGKKRPDHREFMLNMDSHPMTRPEVLEKMSGDNHWSNNPIHRKICEYCNKEVSKSNYKMYHGNNCKVKNNG